MATCKCIKQPDVLISYTCKPIKETEGPNSYAHLISMVWSSRISWANSQRSWINSLEKLEKQVQVLILISNIHSS
jgi:hypothetical protein